MIVFIYLFLGQAISYYQRYQLSLICCAIIKMKNSGNKLIIKVTYNDIPLVKAFDKYYSVITLDTILNLVNDYIKLYKIEQFLQIEIKRRNSWQSIIQFFNLKARIDLQGENSDSLINNIQIRLIDGIKRDMLEIEKIKKFVIRANDCYEKLYKIESKIAKDANEIIVDYQIDLCFFYAEPLIKQSTRHRRNFQEQINDNEVSFLREISTIQTKLKKLDKQLVRSSSFCTTVASVNNFHAILKKGVKIFHLATHGHVEYMQIQCSGLQQIGVLELMKADAFIAILKQHKLPQIIVLNVCLSDTIARTVYEHFKQRGQHIITIGYTVSIFDWETELFSQEFYSQLFKGKPVQECFQRTSCDKSRVHIYGDDLGKVLFQPVDRIDNLKSLDTHNVAMACESIPDLSFKNKKLALVNFLRTFLQNTESRVMSVVGPSRTGKSVCVKKSLAYLKQRQAISQFLYMDFRDSGYEISNYIQFRYILEQKMCQFRLFQKIKQNSAFVIVLDHCDQINTYNKREFYDYIENLERTMKKIQIIFILKQYANFKNVKILRYELKLNHVYVQKVQISPEMESLNDLIKQVKEIKLSISKLITRFYDIITSTFPAIMFISLKILNLVSNSNQSEDELKSGKQIQQTCITILKIILYKLTAIKHNKFNDLDYDQLQTILQLLMLITASQLIFSVDKTNKNNLYQQNNNILKIIYKVIETCFIICKFEFKDQYKNLHDAFRIMLIKQHFLVYSLNRQAKRDQKYNQIIEDYLQNLKVEGLVQLQDIKLLELLNINEWCISWQQHNSIRLFDDDARTYIKTLYKMKQKAQLSNKLCPLFQKRQIQILFKPILKMAKDYLNIAYKSNHVECYNIKFIVQLLEQFKEIDLGYPCLNEVYIENMFLIQKIKIKFQDKLHLRLNKFQICQKFNDWIQTCKNMKKKKLKNSIRDYINQTFIIFPTFVSPFFNKTFRFQQKIAQMKRQIFQLMQKQVLVKLLPFSIDKMTQLNKINARVPIALFIKDGILSEQICKKQKIHYNKDHIFFAVENKNNENPQELQYIQSKELLKNIKANIAIFCGKNVKNLPKQQALINSNAVILISTQKKILQKEKQKFKSVDQQIQETYFSTINNLIVKNFLFYFYINFVENLKKEQANNKNLSNAQKIKLSFQIAKFKAKHICLNKYGMYELQIWKLQKNVVLYISDKHQISEFFKFNNKYVSFKKEQEHLTNPITKKYKLDLLSEVAYCKSLKQIRQIIMHTNRQQILGQSLKINLICKINQQITIINSLCLKLKMIDNVQVQIYKNRRKASETIQQLRQSQLYSQKINNMAKVLIVDLSQMNIIDAEQQILKQIQTEPINLYKSVKIFITNQYLISNQAKKHINNVFQISMIDNQNIVPIICQKTIMKAIQSKKSSRHWDKYFLTKLTNYIKNNIITERIRKVETQYLSEVAKRNKKIEVVTSLFTQLTN